MMDALYIAWKYITHNKWRSVTLVACVTLITALPLALDTLLDESERQLLARSTTTPLIVGSKGSALDLVMNTLYFDDEVPELTSMTAADEIADTGLALPIPVYARFRARGFPVIGTTLDYFEFRGLQIAAGRNLAVLGECVLGAGVADSLGLKPGDSIVSSPETVFDLAGVYPLKMKIVGVLEPARTPDDLAIFVDIKTAWVIEGLGHGHEDLARTRDESVIMERSGGKIVANAKLMQYREITEENIDSFHFHGEASRYPVTAIIAVPSDTRSGTILRGRYLKKEAVHQIVKPREVIDGLLQNIFRIKNVLDAVIMVVAIATMLALILVFALSLRLRQREIDTIFKLGCSRLTIARLISAEIGVILLISGALCAGLVGITQYYGGNLVQVFFIG